MSPPVEDGVDDDILRSHDSVTGDEPSDLRLRQRQPLLRLDQITELSLVESHHGLVQTFHPANNKISRLTSCVVVTPPVYTGHSSSSDHVVHVKVVQQILLTHVQQQHVCVSEITLSY